MIKMLTETQAVVLVDNAVAWQLEAPTKGTSGNWKFNHILFFPTKAEAKAKAIKMGFPANHVCKFSGRFGFTGYAIQYDFRYPYYIAAWEA